MTASQNPDQQDTEASISESSQESGHSTSPARPSGAAQTSRPYGAEVSGLLDRDSPPEYVREWTERIAREQQTTRTGTQSAVIFRIGAEWLAFDTRAVREIAVATMTHKIPHRDGVLIGLVSIRGELLICASLSLILGLAEATHSKAAGVKGERLLILENRGERVAFPVDEVEGVYTYHPDDLEAVPATLAGTTTLYTIGLLPWRDHAVGYLDMEPIMRKLNTSLL
jgi:chemotaxis-related protein WspD